MLTIPILLLCSRQLSSDLHLNTYIDRSLKRDTDAPVHPKMIAAATIEALFEY